MSQIEIKTKYFKRIMDKFYQLALHSQFYTTIYDNKIILCTKTKHIIKKLNKTYNTIFLSSFS
jgi:hypothetical protein